MWVSVPGGGDRLHAEREQVTALLAARRPHLLGEFRQLGHEGSLSPPARSRHPPPSAAGGVNAYIREDHKLRRPRLMCHSERSEESCRGFSVTTRFFAALRMTESFFAWCPLASLAPWR